MINKLYPSSTSYSNNTSCSFCLFLHIFLPSLCSPFLYFSFPICLICFVLYSYISYLSTMFCGFYLFLFLYNFNVVNYFLLKMKTTSVKKGMQKNSIEFFTSPFQKHSTILLHKMSFRLHIINDVSIQPVPCFLLSFLQNMHAHLYHHSVPDETQLQAGCPVLRPQLFHLLRQVSLPLRRHRQYTVHG